MQRSISPVASFLSLMLVLTTIGLQHLEAREIKIVALPSPAPDLTLTGNLTASEKGLYLSWLEERPEGHALRFAVWDGEVFTTPQTIHTSDHFFANWADFASMVALADGSVATHWLEKAASGTYQYDIWMSVSDDNGTTWSPPERPHRDGTLSEHGFVSLAPLSPTGFAAVWLDGRKFRDGADDNEMTLMFTTFEDGRFQPERQLDGRVCECCQTAMARTRDGLFVAYRDRSPEEIRDIAVVRFVDGQWTMPERLHADGWEIPGCPVNGPQVSADGDDVAVAWFTASRGEPRVHVAFSSDGGESFGEPVRVDDGRPLGRVDIEMVGDGAVVTWLERAADGQADVRLRHVTSEGASETAHSLAQTGAGRASGFPRMAVFGRDVYVTWTDASTRQGPSRVQLARVVIE